MSDDSTDAENTYERLSASIARFADTSDRKTESAPIRGVAIGENDITTGLSGEKTVWTADVMQAAAEQGRLGRAKVIRGKAGIGHYEMDEQAAPEDIVGSVEIAYEPGVGLVFDGSLLDEHLADLVDNDLLAVSPDLYRRLGEPSDDPEHDGARVVSELLSIPRITLVDTGAVPSNDIQRADVEALAYSDLPKCQRTPKVHETSRSHMAKPATKDDTEERLAALHAEKEDLQVANEQLEAENRMLKQPYLDALTEDTDLSAEDISLDAEGLAEHFGASDNGSLEQLTTEPLTGAAPAEPDDDDSAERLSRTEEERLGLLREKRRILSGRPGLDEQVESINDEIEQLAARKENEGDR